MLEINTATMSVIGTPEIGTPGQERSRDGPQRRQENIPDELRNEQQAKGGETLDPQVEWQRG